MGDRHTVAMTRHRGEVVRAIAADAMFSEDPERSLGAVRASVWYRISQVLSGGCTIAEIHHACCEEPEAERAGRRKR